MEKIAITGGWLLDQQVMPGERLRQGDLVAFQDADPLRKFGLVVTVDCDLQKQKHGRLITMVPVVDLKTVVEHYLLLEQCDRQREKLLCYARKHFLFPNTFDAIAEEELRSTITERNHDPSWHIPCLAANVLLNKIDMISGIDFCDLMKAIGVATVGITQRLDNQLRSKGDIILLPSAAGLGISADMAWVRQVWQVPVRQIVFRNSETRPTFGQRIARLDSPYRYRVTQLMGQVFADIGMPDSQRNFLSDLDGVLSQ